MDDNLRSLIDAVSNESSVQGIRFQARYSPTLLSDTRTYNVDVTPSIA